VIARTGTEPRAHDLPGSLPAVREVEPVVSREAIVRWSGVACLYAGAAAALASLWSPV
jgi:hypothetical protein